MASIKLFTKSKLQMDTYNMVSFISKNRNVLTTLFFRNKYKCGENIKICMWMRNTQIQDGSYKPGRGWLVDEGECRVLLLYL